VDASGWAHTHTSGLFIVQQSFNTQVAFDGNFQFIFELHGPEGTGLDTLPASDAEIIVNQNNALLISRNRFHGTGFLTGRFCTMVTVYGDEIR
jgi:hypothetical protein